MKPKSITLYDVARHAGVSYQTVSRVINRAEHVSERTREKVEQAMAQLHYVPNRLAQQLAGKAQRTLGLVTADLSLHAPSQIAAAVKRRATLAGYNVVMSMPEDGSQAACEAAVAGLLAQRVDALLINVPLEDEAAREIAARSQPLPVLFLDVGHGAPVPSMVFDAAQGAQLGIAHLLALGHRRIACLAGPQESVSARLRHQGWRDALHEAGLTPCVEAHGDWSAASGYHHAHAILAARPDAVVVANDQMALGVLHACAEQQIPVPDAISIVGYDDTADSAWFTPALTTVRQDFRVLGEKSVEWLLARLHAAPLAENAITLPVSLIPRHTSGPRRDSGLTPQQIAARLTQLAQQVADLDRANDM